MKTERTLWALGNPEAQGHRLALGLIPGKKEGYRQMVPAFKGSQNEELLQLQEELLGWNSCVHKAASCPNQRRE